MPHDIHLGISTCPNDTFAFHGILQKKVDLRGLKFRTELCDVQDLNERLFRGEFDVAKTSFHAALLLAEKIVVLSSGSALGFGVGPLLLAAKANTSPSDSFGERRPLVLCPGEHTTAHLLYRLFHPNEGEVRHAVFSEIMPALQTHKADFGVCIHEGRFTYQEQGLHYVEDLGETWEQKTSAPLPLGGIVARTALGDEKISAVQSVLHDSIHYAINNRHDTLSTMRKYAQEFTDDVLFAHVDLYVNHWTQSLGVEGGMALDQLAMQAAKVGMVNEQVKLKIAT